MKRLILHSDLPSHGSSPPSYQNGREEGGGNSMCQWIDSSSFCASMPFLLLSSPSEFLPLSQGSRSPSLLFHSTLSSSLPPPLFPSLPPRLQLEERPVTVTVLMSPWSILPFPFRPRSMNYFPYCSICSMVINHARE